MFTISYCATLGKKKKEHYMFQPQILFGTD